jgi:hypothetical protein
MAPTCTIGYTTVCGQNGCSCQIATSTFALPPLQDGQPSNPIIKALNDFWNWLNCLFGYCA